MSGASTEPIHALVLAGRRTPDEAGVGTQRHKALEPVDGVPMLERVVAAGFGQRRKMLRSSLRQITPDAEDMLQGLGIDPKRRAEELQIGDFCRIANVMAARARPADSARNP